MSGFPLSKIVMALSRATPIKIIELQISFCHPFIKGMVKQDYRESVCLMVGGNPSTADLTGKMLPQVQTKLYFPAQMSWLPLTF